MGKTLYLECNAGISGDMTVGALLDLGADEEVLREALNSIPAEGFSIEIGRVKKAGIDCCDFGVRLDAAHENHDHDMAYLHGHLEEHGHEAPHSHHEHRGMKEIQEILEVCRMTEPARAMARRIFQILAEAEAKAHQVPVEEVHFHEVGAIDSIVDVVAAAVCLDNLGVREVILPRLCEGRGTVRCQHGILPVPVPAVANIVSAYSIPLEWMDIQGEFVTPTGAAIAAAVRTSDRLPGSFRIGRIGMGAGKRQYERPSILRAMLIAPVEDDGSTDTVHSLSAAGATAGGEAADVICKLETNIDDSTGEMLGYTMEKLLEAGARDVHYIPVYMKKNRPAWLLNVICSEADIPVMEQIIFCETTTIGVRRIRMERTVLEREQMDLKTPYGTAAVKVCRSGNGTRYYPEYESVAAICRAQNLPYRQVFLELQELADAAGRQTE